MDILQLIRKRSREEWEQLALDGWTDLRIWIQEHGESAALIALVAGIALVLFIKLVLVLLVAGLILAFTVLFLALPEGKGEGAGSSGRSLSAQEDTLANRPAQGPPGGDAPSSGSKSQ